MAFLVEREVARRDERRIEMAFKIAHFPAVRELADFDFKAQPSVDERQVRELAASRWVAHGDAALLLGPSETVGRVGKNRERAATREAKVGALRVLERDGAGRPRTVPGSVVLFAAVENAAETPGGESEFERRLLRELAAGHAPEDVGFAVGDGAGRVRRLFDDWFPKSERVVDHHHAAEHLWAAARARHGPGDLAAAWARKLCGMPRPAASTTVSAAGCPSAPGGSRRPARPSWAGE